MAQWVQQAVGHVSGVEGVSVALTFEPPWRAKPT
jgi:metal-sulfur cluster biosynthetic enzyme